jgi:RNA polymerase sigma factor (sigma-70 family)
MEGFYMDSRLIVPSDINELFGIPGKCWPDSAVLRVKEWLNVNPQREFLVLYALRVLQRQNKLTTRQDAEDVWGKYCAPKLKSGISDKPLEHLTELDGVIQNYDPNIEEGLGFLDYLFFCFKRYCWRQRFPERSLQQTCKKTKDNEFFEFEFVYDGPDPERAYIAKAKLLAVQRCIEELGELRQNLILMHVFDSKSLKECSLLLGINENNAKQLLRRARLQMKTRLGKEGWI